MTKKGEEMWKTELETLQAIAAIGKISVRMPEIVALFPSLLPRTIYYRVERLVDHGLVTKKKSDYRWNEITITEAGERMLQ